MIEFVKFKSFVALARTGSFSKAAEIVGMSQPVVSIYIKQLEEEYGVKLVDRLGRKNVLTKEGEVFLKYVSDILRLEERLRDELSSKKGVLKGRLCIGGSNIPGTYVLPKLAGEFLKDNRKVRISTEVGDSMEILRRVVEGPLEFGMVGAIFDDRKVESEPVLSDRLVLIAPPDFEKDVIAPEELFELPYIQRESGSGTRKTVEGHLRRAFGKFSLNTVLFLSSNEAVKRSVSSGAGVSFVSEVSVRDEISMGLLKKVDVDGLSMERVFCLVKRRRKTLSPTASAFYGYIAERCKGEG